MPPESRLIPDRIQVEVKVQVQLPPEAQTLLRDLHGDRQGLGIAGTIALACLVALTLKTVFGRSSSRA